MLEIPTTLDTIHFSYPAISEISDGTIVEPTEWYGVGIDNAVISTWNAILSTATNNTKSNWTEYHQQLQTLFPNYTLTILNANFKGPSVRLIVDKKTPKKELLVISPQQTNSEERQKFLDSVNLLNILLKDKPEADLTKNGFEEYLKNSKNFENLMIEAFKTIPECKLALKNVLATLKLFPKNDLSIYYKYIEFLHWLDEEFWTEVSASNSFKTLLMDHLEESETANMLLRSFLNFKTMFPNNTLKPEFTEGEFKTILLSPSHFVRNKFLFLVSIIPEWKDLVLNNNTLGSIVRNYSKSQIPNISEPANLILSS